MQKEIDYTALLQTIEKMQKELRVLQHKVMKLQLKQNHKQRNKKRSFKSLYGIFPPLPTTMEDYREVRRSGTPRSLRES